MKKMNLKDRINFKKIIADSREKRRMTIQCIEKRRWS